jgi:RND family efflux transporter MFP subunit
MATAFSFLLGPLAVIGAAVNCYGADTPTVSVMAARQETVVRKLTVVGTVVPKETTLINVDLDGTRIETVLVEEGDLVSRGQVLATLDSSKLDVELLQNDAQNASAIAQIGQAESALETALITREETRADLQRGEKLGAKGLLSEEILEQRRNALARASASINSARQAIKAAEAAAKTTQMIRREIERRLRQTTIVSPSAGRILSRTAKVGAIASSSGQPLFVLANDDEFELEVEIPQSQYPDVAAGARASISTGYGQPNLAGFVRFVAPALADGTRLGRARIGLARGRYVPAGAFATAEIEIGNDSGIFLPSSAITGNEDDPSVKILKDNRIEQKRVSLGVRQSGYVQVRTGLAVGDLIVLRAGSFVNVGDSALPYQVSFGLPGDRTSTHGN